MTAWEASQVDANQEKLELALQILERFSQASAELRQKQIKAARYDTNTRMALPAWEPINATKSLPGALGICHLVASDGSQITPDRHLDITAGVVNLAAYVEVYGQESPPWTTTSMQLLYHQTIQALGEDHLSMDLVHRLRDLEERIYLVDLCLRLESPVIGIMDGPAELWEANVGTPGSGYYHRLTTYRQMLTALQPRRAVVGYVDRPGANPVCRMLEIALIPEERLSEIADHHPLSGVTDRSIYYRLLAPGQRSTVYSMHSLTAKSGNETNFFYLNVGNTGAQHIARIEASIWVCRNSDLLNLIQAVLYDQCQRVEALNYPYALARSHEEAVVTQADRMLFMRLVSEHRDALNLWNLGLSPKQSFKALV
jgi:hypothetical protein